jgi:hypothetical protein
MHSQIVNGVRGETGRHVGLPLQKAMRRDEPMCSSAFILHGLSQVD